jgi:hypothetical protein
MQKIIANYRLNGRRRHGRPLKRLLGEAESGLTRPNSWRMMMMMMIVMMVMTVQIIQSHDWSVNTGKLLDVLYTHMIYTQYWPRYT